MGVDLQPVHYHQPRYQGSDASTLYLNVEFDQLVQPQYDHAGGAAPKCVDLTFSTEPIFPQDIASVGC